MEFRVTISELRAAAARLSAAAAEYGEATNATKAAADTLAAGWEGDAQVAFVEEQEEAIRWYHQVVEVVEAYVRAIYSTADLYEKFDEESRATVG